MRCKGFEEILLEYMYVHVCVMLHAADARSVFIATASWVLHQTAISMNKYQQQCISFQGSRVAQWERAGPITQRSMDRNHPLLRLFLPSYLHPPSTHSTHSLCSTNLNCLVR